MIGVTTQDSFDPHGQAPENAVFLNRFIHIDRAGRVIAAVGAQIRGNSPLINPNCKKYQVL
jgi:hypothetical protein